MIIAFNVIKEDKFLISLMSCVFEVTRITCERHKRCSWRRMPMFIACHMSLRCTISHINLWNCFEMTYCGQKSLICVVLSRQSRGNSSVIWVLSIFLDWLPIVFYTFIIYRKSTNIKLHSWILCCVQIFLPYIFYFHIHVCTTKWYK